MAIAAGRVNPRHAYFPVYANVAEFDKSARGLCKDIPEEIFALFRALKPYKGGNDILWALNRIAISEKHKIVTAMGAILMGTHFRIETHGLDSYCRCPQVPVWGRTNNEIVIAFSSHGTTLKYNFQSIPLVVFEDIEIVGGQPVVPVFHNAANEVHNIIVAVEAEARRCGFLN